MAVVTIVGVLAIIGIVALRKHVFGSKTVEALAMVQSIRAAEERWRAENLTYLNVSTTNHWYPSKPDGKYKRAFYTGAADADDRNWRLLAPTVPGPVEFGYLVNAGDPHTAMTAPSSDVTVTGLTWPNPPGQYWYVIQAIGDADGDGKYAFFMASSFKGDVYRQDEGE